jgi:hypothetical protein
MSGYYQFGKTPSGQKISAYYIQPEVRYSGLKNTTVRLGMEYLSGDNASDTSNVVFNSFVPLYGVAHRFMGYMDYFARFPDDVKGAGLVNPYLFFAFDISKKVTIKTDYHLFFLQNNYVYKGSVINKYLGFENDLLFLYKPSKEVAVEMGYSWMLATNSMEVIRGGDSDKFPHWFYLMVTVKPELFSYKK